MGAVTTSVILGHLNRLPEKAPPSMRPSKCSEFDTHPGGAGELDRALTCLVTPLRSMVGSLPCLGCFIAQSLSYLWPANVESSFVG